MSRKFIVALHFEANLEIEAENEEDAIDKGYDLMHKRHVYVDDEVAKHLAKAYMDGAEHRPPPDKDPKYDVIGVAAISDPDYICDNDPVILEEIKDEH